MENNIEKNVEQNEEIIANDDQNLVSEEKASTPIKSFPVWVIPVAIAVVITIAVAIILPNLIKNNDPVYADYTVTVIDGVGNPMANVIVKFTNANGESKTRVTGKDGLAVLKNVLVGEYQIKVEKGYSDAVVLQSEYSLTADVTSLKVMVRDEKKTAQIYGEIPEGTVASIISAGNYNIPCGAGQTTYYIFRAHDTGIYEVSLDSNDTEMKIGYYGIPMFVQPTHRGEGEYDGKTFELIVQDAATPYVLGITATKNADAQLSVERIGEAPFDPQFAPWTIVQPTEEFTKCILPSGTTFTDIDVTNPGVSVILGDDGYYYTADGKLVYLRINSTPNANYLDVSIAFIAGLVDKNFGQNFGGYVYDSEGNFKAKYSYNEMLASYYEYCDVRGVYPLTAELAEAIKVHGESTGWWNPNAANYLFGAVNEVKENAWLFLCCTAN